ncbi:MAG TPA: hypothetical protein VGL76_11730 [Gaiellaceae bacterium]
MGRLAVLLVGVALVATACGQSKHTQVENYLNVVNATERKLAQPMQEVTTANQAFAKQRGGAKVESQLAKAEKTLQQLRGRIAAIGAPASATHLRALLLELLDHEVALTEELRELAAFVPSFDAALRPLAAADTNLKSELSRTAKGSTEAKALDAAKAQALETYASTVSGVISKLRELQPPAVWKPAYTGQLATLVQLRSSGSALAGAIAGGHAAAVPKLLRAFDAAAVVDQSVAAQRAQIAAVNAYDRRVKAVNTIARKIERERSRLQSVTG